MSEDGEYMSDTYLQSHSSFTISARLRKWKRRKRCHQEYMDILNCVQSDDGSGIENEHISLTADRPYENRDIGKRYKKSSLTSLNDGILEPVNIEATNEVDLKGTNTQNETQAEVNSITEECIEVETNIVESTPKKIPFHINKKYYIKAQEICANFDSEDNMQFPIEDYYWPKYIIDRLNPIRLTKIENETDDTLNETKMMKNLGNIINYIRTKYWYCVFCGYEALDDDGLRWFCPGPDLEDHGFEF